jgi:hypothetical protein
MTEIPQNPWEVVSVDFGEPYPDGHYNLVVIDKRTRYLEVEKLHTTACKQTKEKLKKIFSTHARVPVFAVLLLLGIRNIV